MSTAPPPVRAPREYGGGRLWQGRVRPIGPNEGGLLCLFFGFSGLHTNCFMQKVEVNCAPFLLLFTRSSSVLLVSRLSRSGVRSAFIADRHEEILTATRSMTDKDDVTAAVLRALQSNFRGMTRGKLVGAVGFDLGVEIDGGKDLKYLLMVMQNDGLIRAEKSTWFITEKGKDQIADAVKVGLSQFVSLFCVSFGFCAIGTK